MEFLSDPNVIYLLLMCGLWVSATGTYIPGTGVAEVAGAGLIIGTLYLLTALATNWIAVLALVVGAALFFLLPLLKSEWEPYAIGGLAIQALASLSLFEGAAVSPLLIAFGVLLAWTYHRTVLRAILRQQAGNCLQRRRTNSWSAREGA